MRQMSSSQKVRFQRLLKMSLSRAKFPSSVYLLDLCLSIVGVFALGTSPEYILGIHQRLFQPVPTSAVVRPRWRDASTMEVPR